MSPTQLFPALFLFFQVAYSQNFVYPNFTSLEGLVLKNSAQVVGNDLRITPATPTVNGVGSAWRSTKTLVAHGFDTTFTFKIGGGTGADGFAFVVHNDPQGLQSIGIAGGGMGYADVLSCLIVEFDTHQNPEGADPSQNHVAALSRGVRVISSNHNASLLDKSVFIPSFSLEDNQYHVARVRYVPGVLEIYIGQSALPALPSITYNVNITNIAGNSILDPAGQAFIGFTASTGGLTNNHDLSSWSFLSTPAPTTGDPVAAIAINSICIEWFGVLGDRYQVVGSLNLSTWTPLGVTFIGANQPMQHFEKITEAHKFFKILRIP